MNELQQVLIIFAVVVIAGLYFLSRSRQNEMKKNASDQAVGQNASAPENTRDEPVVSHSKIAEPSVTSVEVELNQPEPYIDASEVKTEKIEDVVVTKDVENAQQPTVAEEFTATAETQVEQISEEPSENAYEQPEVEQKTKKLTPEEEFNQNQGTLSFGEEFDLPPEEESDQAALAEEDSKTIAQPEIQMEDYDLPSTSGKHHVLVVDDPGLNGEIDESTVPSEHIKPSFGIPEEELQNRKVLSGTNKEPQAFVIMMLTTGKNFKMVDVNQALHGVGLKLSEDAIFVKSDANGKPFIKVANMLEPGTFPVEDLEDYETPGVVMILELPTTVRAPAAMDDLILIARKISQRLGGRLYDMDRHLIRESDFQSMRDTALDYESEPLT